MNNNQQPFYFSTWFIVLAFIVFWPVGIALIIMKTKSSKKNMFDGGRAKKLFAIGVILILAGLGSFGDNTAMGIFWLAGGAGLIYVSNQNKKKVLRCKAYIDLVANQGVRSIDTISNTVGWPYDKTKAELQSLIDMGSFRGASINELTRSLDVAAQVNPMQMQMQQNYANNGIMGSIADVVTDAVNGALAGRAVPNDMPQQQMVTATCPGCGGTMVAVKGTAVECEYCGKIYTA